MQCENRHVSINYEESSSEDNAAYYNSTDDDHGLYDDFFWKGEERYIDEDAYYKDEDGIRIYEKVTYLDDFAEGSFCWVYRNIIDYEPKEGNLVYEALKDNPHYISGCDEHRRSLLFQLCFVGLNHFYYLKSQHQGSFSRCILKKFIEEHNADINHCSELGTLLYETFYNIAKGMPDIYEKEVVEEACRCLKVALACGADPTWENEEKKSLLFTICDIEHDEDAVASLMTAYLKIVKVLCSDNRVKQKREDMKKVVKHLFDAASAGKDRKKLILYFCLELNIPIPAEYNNYNGDRKLVQIINHIRAARRRRASLRSAS